jgi:hypothetical protein
VEKNLESIGKKMNEDLPAAIELLSVFAQIQKWEAQHSSFMGSASGRQLYFGLIRHLARAEGMPFVGSMKEIYCDDGLRLTERGVRLTMRAFEADGVVFVEKADGDKRSRRIFITEKLENQMISHAEVIRKELGQKFIFIKK